MKFVEIPGSKPLYQIDGLFTEEECEALILKASKIRNARNHPHDKAWHRADTDGAYHRVIMVDQELADSLWKKIKPILKDSCGRHLVEINDHFRYSRYHPGGSFPIHCDGKNFGVGRSGKFEYALESVFTLNIFLNDDFEGGETDFFEEEDLRASIKPKPGRAALFIADQPHRGNKVIPGKRTKYLLRTDVMAQSL